MSIVAYDNFLNKDDWDYVVEKTLRGDSWRFASLSRHDVPGYTFWIMDLLADKFFTEYMLSLIEKKFNYKFKLLDVYANGQTYGLPGNWHKDEIEISSKFKTFIFYVNPTWDPQLGGSTIFTDTEYGVYSQPFIPNTGLLFDSNITHVGLDPTRHCADLRVTVAFKLEKL